MNTDQNKEPRRSATVSHNKIIICLLTRILVVLRKVRLAPGRFSLVRFLLRSSRERETNRPQDR